MVGGGSGRYLSSGGIDMAVDGVTITTVMAVLMLRWTVIAVMVGGGGGEERPHSGF